MGNLKLTLDGAEPVVSIQWLNRVTKHWWVEADEAFDSDSFILTLSSIALNPLKEPYVVGAIGFIHGHQLDHRWRWRKVNIILWTISTATTTITTTASTTQHPEKKTRTMRYRSTGRNQQKITYTKFKAQDGKQDM
jgi:hypothetical protein